MYNYNSFSKGKLVRLLQERDNEEKPKIVIDPAIRKYVEGKVEALEDGYVYFDTRGVTDVLASYHLTQIAAILDEMNAEHDKEVQNGG